MDENGWGGSVKTVCSYYKRDVDKRPLPNVVREQMPKMCPLCLLWPGLVMVTVVSQMTQLHQWIFMALDRAMHCQISTCQCHMRGLEEVRLCSSVRVYFLRFLVRIVPSTTCYEQELHANFHHGPREDTCWPYSNVVREQMSQMCPYCVFGMFTPVLDIGHLCVLNGC